MQLPMPFITSTPPFTPDRAGVALCWGYHHVRPVVIVLGWRLWLLLLLCWGGHRASDGSVLVGTRGHKSVQRVMDVPNIGTS